MGFVFRQPLAEQSKVLVMKEFIHDGAPHITSASATNP